MSERGLRWPANRPRTPAGQRKYGRFATRHIPHGRSWSQTESVTISQALDRLDDEVERLGGRYPNVTTDVETRLDGRPRSGARKPDDPGVAVYFVLHGEEIVLACDTYTEVAQNIAAIAAHIDATRAIERYGVGTAREMFQAFLALPEPGAKRNWWEVLQVDPGASYEAVRAAYNRLAKERHPDRGGSDAMMAELNAARDEGLA